MPSHAGNTTAIVGTKGCVPRVFGSRNYTEIVDPVVCSVSVYVVYLTIRPLSVVQSPSCAVS